MFKIANRNMQLMFTIATHGMVGIAFISSFTELAALIGCIR
jgi:hypothetical protein